RATRRRAAAGEPVPGGLDLLLGGLDEAGLPLEDDDLVEQLLLLLFAGYETTASSLSCLMAAVLAEPDLQAWLRPEVGALPWPPAPGTDAGPDDLERFRPQRHLDGEAGLTLLPFGGGERVCLGKALAELEIRLMAVGLLRGVPLALVPGQDVSLATIPSPSPRGGLLVRPAGGGAGAGGAAA
ncbi:MAG: cytochrome P450, partial [Cyanobium sp.]